MTDPTALAAAARAMANDAATDFNGLSPAYQAEFLRIVGIIIESYLSALPDDEGIVERLRAWLVAVRDSQVPTGDDGEMIVGFEPLMRLFDAGYAAMDAITRLQSDLRDAREAARA